jgi:hypothetical protein
MATIDDTNYELLAAIEHDYARILRDVVTQIFDENVEVADSFKRSLEDSPIRERLLALHESPLEIAAALTGRSIDDRMRGQYERLLADARSEHPSDKFDVPKDAHSQLPLEFVGYLLYVLGYEPVHEIGDNILAWKLGVSLLPGMRPIVFTPKLPARHFEGIKVSNKAVLELLNHVFMRRLSSSDVEFILKDLLSTSEEPWRRGRIARIRRELTIAAEAAMRLYQLSRSEMARRNPGAQVAISVSTGRYVTVRGSEVEEFARTLAPEDFIFITPVASSQQSRG